MTNSPRSPYCGPRDGNPLFGIIGCTLLAVLVVGIVLVAAWVGAGKVIQAIEEASR